jgi:class 3 adenylate cyclase
MFCDLVGSTALSARLDPEDLREVIGAYHRRVAKVVGRYDGFVAKYMGDGVLIYFGYPRAHEDDAERAVRAGLKLVQTMGTIGEVKPQADIALQARIGIATGLVVVGDLIGSGEARGSAGLSVRRRTWRRGYRRSLGQTLWRSRMALVSSLASYSNMTTSAPSR